jgi:asparagine synthase (glutamine-hydrolysing)
MCGITALFAYGSAAPPVNPVEVEHITQRMFPRGPDAGGVWLSADARVGFGSRRLAIIDLHDDAAQPMTDVERELTIVFNGEIYNHLELKRRLEKRGARFRTTSDTEVLLQMYRHHGRGMVELLRGMFAFAIWDSRERKMFVARDPYGIKPLYFADDGQTIRIASQVKALLAGDAVSRTRDPAGIAGFFLLGSVPEPFTTFDSIRAVEAGTAFFVDENGRGDAWRYESIAAVLRNAESQRHIARLVPPNVLLRELVTESIDYHLISDVPVGAFLSAGIDSTTLVALAQSRSREAIRTVTILFDVYRNQDFDETREADEFARQRGMPHTTRVVTRDEFVADMPKIFDQMDQPTIDGVNTWFVSKAAAEQELKVALSGVGGDELFGSYPSFTRIPRIVAAVRAAERVPLGSRALSGALATMRRTNPKTKTLAKYGGTYAGAFLVQRGLYMPDELPAIVGADVAEEGLRRLSIIEHIARMLAPDPGSAYGRVAALEASLYMRNQLLRDTDWASMAHSVEVRTPLVDASLLRQLAPLILEHGTQCKDDFANSPETPLPESIRTRRKTGFVTPLKDWMELPPDGTSTRIRQWSRIVFEHFS